MRVLICVLVFLTFSCSNSEEDTSNICNPVVIDESKYNSSQNFGTNLTEFEVVGDCLMVKLGVGGCDDEHTIEMVSDGSWAYSLPPQITFDFYDQNPQICQAYFIIDRAFDLSPLKELYDGDFIIKFRNSDHSFTYGQ